MLTDGRVEINVAFQRQRPPVAAVYAGHGAAGSARDIPAFLLTSYGKPFTAAGIGNKFGDAARAAGVFGRLHGLRKAFCVYWAEHGATANEIAAMSGHLTLGEVERYTRAADRKRMAMRLASGA